MGERRDGRALGSLEPYLYAGVLVALWSAQLFCSFVMDRPADTEPGWFFHDHDPFGFFQLRGLGIAWLPLAYGGALLALGIVHRGAGWLSRTRAPRLPLWLLLAIASFACFFALRTHFLNPDGVAFSTDIPNGVARNGTYFTHDEILELHLHARVWAHLYAAFHTSVTETYQLVSCVFGALFMVLLVRFALDSVAGAAVWFVVLVVSCGFMQLFFGDVENYTITTVLLTAYLYAGFRVLHRDGNVVVPSLLLGVAMCFHLLAGWLGCSLVYLWWRELRRGRRRRALAGLGVFVATGVAILAWAADHGVPLRNLYYSSHALGHGGNLASMLVTPTVHYYRRLADLSFLLLPVWPLLVALALCGRIPLGDPFNRFLLIALSLLVLFMCSWNAQLGAYNDWNLFSPVALTAAILLFYNLVRCQDLPWQSAILTATFALAAVHSYAWIVANHRFVMPP